MLTAGADWCLEYDFYWGRITPSGDSLYTISKKYGNFDITSNTLAVHRHRGGFSLYSRFPRAQACCVAGMLCGRHALLRARVDLDLVDADWRAIHLPNLALRRHSWHFPSLSLRAKTWKLKVDFFDKINSVLDRNEWHMSPQTVNAYFSPTQNEIVFPAAILQVRVPMCCACAVRALCACCDLRAYFEVQCSY